MPFDCNDHEPLDTLYKKVAWGLLNGTLGLGGGGKTFVENFTTYADASGNIVAFGTIKFDQDTNTETKVFYDTNLDIIASLPVGASIVGSKDLEIVSKGFQSTATPSIKFTRLSLVNTLDNSVTIIWQDATGTVIPTPSGIEPDVEDSLTPEDDTISIGDQVTGDPLKINSDGSLDVNILKKNLELIQEQADYNQVINWLDIGTSDQRPQNIVHSSTTLGQTLTETFTWSGSAGNFYVTNIAIS